MIVELDAATDERLEQVRAQVEESGIRSVLALGLVVGDDPIGVLAVYPRERRPLSQNERSLLTALAGQLAVVVQNARLHERVIKLYDDLKQAHASEQEKSNRLKAQHEISRTFAQSLSLQTTLDALASSIVELLGVDAAVIRMPDERGIELVARSVHVNDERVDPAARALLSRPQQLPRRDLLALLRRSEPLLLDAEQAESFGGALALLAPFLRKGSSAALIPIATSAELLATLTIISLHPERPVAGEIAETALAIAGQAALAIDNARLYGQQKAFADTMQRSLLPRAAPELPELELGDVYESAARVEVGGDVYDYLTLGDGRLAVVLGDVTGHGVDATADMAMAKYVFRSLAREHPDPGMFLAAANEVVSSEIAPGRFITMVEVVFDVEGGEVACASAGHPPPRLVLPDGSVQPVAGARARARHRRAADLRHGHGAVPAGRDRRRLHRRRHRGTARRRAVRRRAARRAAGRAARPAAAGDRAGGPRRVPRLDGGRAHRRLRGGRRQALAAAGRRAGMSRSQAALAALVFGAGIGSLATEIAASRMLAPYFGSSTIVWANLIGIVLAGLALGYWLGGKLADRRPERRLLGLIVLAAALWVAMTPFIARPFLDAAVGNLDDASAGAVIGSFFAVLLLFAPAVVLLGMVSPFAIRLAITDVESAGEVAGRFYALSTVGSLVGTFVPALIAIPLVGTQRTLLATAALLAAVGLASCSAGR